MCKCLMWGAMVVALLPAIFACGDDTMMNFGYSNIGYGMMGGFWGFGMVLWTLLLAGLVALVWLWVAKAWKNLDKK